MIHYQALRLLSVAQNSTALSRHLKILVVIFGLIIAHVLEVGILIHSVLVGIDLGVTSHISDTRSLLIALCFHQFFEGLGLGSRVADVNMRKILSVLLIDFVFAASAPVGRGTAPSRAWASLKATPTPAR